MVLKKIISLKEIFQVSIYQTKVNGAATMTKLADITHPLSLNLIK